jgi:cytochrome P450
VVIAGTAEGALELFRSPSENFVVGFGTDAVEPLIGSGSLLLLSGDRHRRERKLMSPFFHGTRMRAYGELIQQTALRHAETWKPGEPFPIHAPMQGIALEVILRAIFGVQSAEEAQRFGDAIKQTIGSLHPAPIFFKGLQRELGGYGPWARFMRHKRRLDVMLKAHVATHRRALERGREAEGSGAGPEGSGISEPRTDVLSQLLLARFDDGSRMSDTDICSQLITLLVAGHETTSTAMAWAFYELHRDPATLKRVRDEIATLGPELDLAEVGRLPLLRAVADETLRLHPLLGEVFRTVAPAGDGYEFQGHRIPVGVSVAASILMIHNDPELYPEPRSFRPERFLERKYGPSEYLPFGGGHRRCIGAAFAMNEMTIVLATLLSRFELELAEPRPLGTVRRNLTLAPEAGVPMRLCGRIA